MKPALVFALLLVAAFPRAQPPAFDIVIRNSRIVDGTGAPWYRGDIALRGEAIAAMGPSIDPAGARVIDAGGRVVAPGFIDIHTHARRGIFTVPTADNYVRQGVTTLIEGPDGGSPVPLGLNVFLDAGAFEVLKDGRFTVVRAKMDAAVTELTRTIMTLQAEGSYDQARAPVERMGVVRPQVQTVLDRLTSVPVDIEPRFTTAEQLR
jgi:hypothetical protein